MGLPGTRHTPETVAKMRLSARARAVTCPAPAPTGTCLYCATPLPRTNQIVCAEHHSHHRRVLHLARQGRELPTCVDCDAPLERSSQKRCAEHRAEEHRREVRDRKRSKRKPVATCCAHCAAPIIGLRADARYCGRGCLETARSYRRWRSMARAGKAAEIRGILGTIFYDDWMKLLRRHGFRCAYCSSPCLLTMDHVVPLSRGGKHTIGNVLPACKVCNCKKSNKLLIEWGGLAKCRGSR